ncbi:hypothetical protein [Streptomyces sp. DH37]|uniref:hypothetical protein n=1 Tax=Streptomyces sp. DH37 TaxID=3040122 RepID=UPI0024432713|nr:hypothetical protein [Streptomyces sp. DH37]MDG9704811.1 hypothetical protein [Streptomyces sp. DH37]
MAQRTTASRAAPVRALLAVAVLLLGALAAGAASAAEPPHTAPPTDARTDPHTAGAPCAAGCDRVPLLHRDSAAERHAPHPAGAALPARAHLARPPAGIRLSALPPETAGHLPHTARHPGRAPPPPPGS